MFVVERQRCGQSALINHASKTKKKLDQQTKRKWCNLRVCSGTKSFESAHRNIDSHAGESWRSSLFMKYSDTAMFKAGRLASNTCISIDHKP